MERKLASIQKILKIEPIENADAIEKATVLGWSLVVKKGEFKVNDLCCYIEIDSMLPVADWNEFLHSKAKEDKIRIKTIRLRGQISQGLALPINILPDFLSTEAQKNEGSWRITEGLDVTELLEIEKYEPTIPAELQGEIKGLFPSFLVKTDETRIQAEPQVLERCKGKEFYITEKIDGSSMTVYLNNGEFGVCSRNIDLKESDSNAFWRVATGFKLKTTLEQLDYNVAIQGELYGKGVQGNKYKLEDLQFRVFSIFDIDKYRFLDLAEFIHTSAILNLDTVPILKTKYILDDTVDSLVELATDTSQLNTKAQREGIVLRPVVEERDEDLGRLSFKVINPEFLIKHGE